MTRPFGVTLVAVLIGVSALANIVLGIFMMLAPLGTGPTVTDLAGATAEIPGYYLFVNGLLSVVLGLMYVWLTRMTLVGSQTAYVLINFLSILNIFFGLFRLPFGWGLMLLSALALVIVNTSSAKAWFTRAAYQQPAGSLSSRSHRLGAQAVEEAHVVAVDVDVDVAAQPAVVEQSVQPAPGTALSRSTRTSAIDGAVRRLDDLAPPREGSQRGRDADLDRHGRQP